MYTRTRMHVDMTIIKNTLYNECYTFFNDDSHRPTSRETVRFEWVAIVLKRVLTLPRSHPSDLLASPPCVLP